MPTPPRSTSRARRRSSVARAVVAAVSGRRRAKRPAPRRPARVGVSASAGLSEGDKRGGCRGFSTHDVLRPHRRWEAWRPRASLGDLLRSHPIVVAIGGESDGAAGVRVAAALDRRYRSGVAAIHVLDVSDLPLFTSLPDAVTFTREPFSEGRFSEDARALRPQCADWLGQPSSWPIHISTGAVAYEVARYAERQGAALVVMGLRRHGIAVDVLHDEATLTVARLARCAVLAVAPWLFGLSRRAIVGVDFGPASVWAARAAG